MYVRGMYHSYRLKVNKVWERNCAILTFPSPLFNYPTTCFSCGRGAGDKRSCSLCGSQVRNHRAVKDVDYILMKLWVMAKTNRIQWAEALDRLTLQSVLCASAFSQLVLLYTFLHHFIFILPLPISLNANVLADATSDKYGEPLCTTLISTPTKCTLWLHSNSFAFASNRRHSCFPLSLIVKCCHCGCHYGCSVLLAVARRWRSCRFAERLMFVLMTSHS